MALSRSSGCSCPTFPLFQFAINLRHNDRMERNVPFRSDGNGSYTNAWQLRQKKEPLNHNKRATRRKLWRRCIRKTREPPRTNTAKRETNPFHSQARDMARELDGAHHNHRIRGWAQKCYVHRLHRRWNRARKAINYTRDDSHDSWFTLKIEWNTSTPDKIRPDKVNGPGFYILQLIGTGLVWEMLSNLLATGLF